MARKSIDSGDSSTQAIGKMNDNFTELYDGMSSGVDYDMNFKSVAHRGFSAYPDGAPENTIPAYRRAAQVGFRYVETDVSFTSDGVAVLLHDATIDRTSNGTGNIGSLTYDQVRQYDFGSWGDWAGSQYAGTQIPSFEEFIIFCKQAILHPYIELKSNGAYTQAQIEGLVDMVEANGMKGKVTWISFSDTFLNYVKGKDPQARLGFLVFDSVTDADITKAQGLMTSTNEVFFNTRGISSAVVSKCKTAGFPLETWHPAAQVNDYSLADLLALDPYFTGITTNKTLAGKLLYDYALEID